MESPSGRECDDRTKRWRERIASTMRCIGAASVVVIGGSVVRRCGVGWRCAVKLVEDAFDPILTGDRIVVYEPEFGCAFQPQPRADLAPQKRGGPSERPGAGLARLVVAEHGIHDASHLQIGADL